MTNFEIKIFANPSGYSELNLNYVPELFTHELVEKRNFDAERGTFADGTYSVFFTRNAFIVSYKFSVPAESQFRDSEAYIAIAVRRGYKLNNANSVFVELRKEFNKFAAIEKEFTPQAIHRKLADFKQIVENNVIIDYDQPRINVNLTSFMKRGIVAYDNDSQRDVLIENPNRARFRDYAIVYILPRTEAGLVYSSLKGAYDAINLSQDEYSNSMEYELRFPDGHTEKIASKTSKIVYTCKMPYCKPLEFNGVLLEKWQEWEITTDEEGLRITIGKKPEPETKNILVLCKDKNGHSCDAPSNLQFNCGRYYHNQKCLVLTGEEISQHVQPLNNDSSLEYQSVGIKDDKIEIIVKQKKAFDFTPILRQVRETTNEEVRIGIYDNTSDRLVAAVDSGTPYYYSEASASSLYFIIPETKKYSELRLQLSESPKNIANKLRNYLKKKESIEVEFVISNKKALKDNSDSPFKCIYYDGKGEKEFDENGRLIIEGLTEGDFKYTIKAGGYKPYKDEIELSRNKKIELDLKRTVGKVFYDIVKDSWGYAILFIVGLFLGGLCVVKIPCLKEYAFEKAPSVDSLRSVIADKDSIIAVKDSIIAEKDTIINKYDSGIKDIVQEVGGNGKTAKPEKNVIVSSGKEKEEAEIFDYILHLDKKSRQAFITGKNKTRAIGEINDKFEKLPQETKNAFEKLFKHAAYHSVDIPKEITTIDEAIKYLNDVVNG